MSSGYWDKILRERIQRRRLLKAGASLSIGAAALALVGCGDDDDDGGGGGGGGVEDTSGLVTRPGDETGDAVAGGVWPRNHGDLEFSIDPTQLISVTSAGMTAPVYSHFVRYGRKLPPASPTPADIEADAMLSWEFADDGLSVTYKLRPDHKFDPRPPTDGRAMTVEDVKWSFERTQALGPLGGPAFAAAGQGGPLESVEIVDDETVRVKLAEPTGSVNELLAYLYLAIAPIEGDNESVLNLQREMRGSGPFRLESLQEGISADYVRNPDWYDSPQPYLDGMKFTFIGEAAVLNSQFAAKGHWDRRAGGDFNPLDTLDLKKRFPELLMIQEAPRLTPASYNLVLGTYFTDERLRRAVSMLLDREQMIGTVRNTSVWTNEGIDLYVSWDSHLSNQSPNWLDPKADELGEDSQWWKYNPAEAKKLMEAVGYDGKELTFTQRASFQEDQTAIVSQFLKEGGFNVVDKAIPAAEWRDTKFAGPGTFEGFFFSTAVSGFNDDGYLGAKYRSEGRDHVVAQDVQELLDALQTMRVELDPERKNELVKDFQKTVAGPMYDVPLMSLQPVLGFDLFWPWFRNTTWSVPGFNVPGSSARPYTVHYVDPKLFEEFGG